MKKYPDLKSLLSEVNLIPVIDLPTLTTKLDLIFESKHFGINLDCLECIHTDFSTILAKKRG